MLQLFAGGESITIDGGKEQCGCVISYKSKWSETPRFLDGLWSVGVGPLGPNVFLEVFIFKFSQNFLK